MRRIIRSTRRPPAATASARRRRRCSAACATWARAREELGLTSNLQLILGIGYEHSRIDMRQTAYTYPLGAGPTLAYIPALRDFDNVAPEASLVWQADPALKLHARIGTAYGIPQSGQLFVTTAGVAGNNTDLKTQTNLGVDLGAEVKLADTLTAELTGYHEWFRNEQVSQSAGVDLLSFTTNVPRSIHRGVEVAMRWTPLPAALPGGYVQANYSYNDQRYTRYVERLTSGAVSAAFDRADKRIPGVIPNFINARVGYDAPHGALAGLGGFAEVTYRSRYFIDNANLLSIPAYTLLNLNLHYDPPAGEGWWSRLSFYASVQNLTDKTYIGSASIISDSLDAAGRQNPARVLMNTTGALYAGQPRTVYVGLKGRF
ncbi:TonB-dependent receptor [Sphingomonas sp. H39-1-10]|uniref:TonB-dependent receptor domain-containing protein n=1 Tax=Sphingomonas pollutisoli TaxID=3030829 RepID=UPI0023B8AF0C|nr:TonB-dependent receptor [Sphingomonas pollutisoli]MDF0488537.1 TonB-dependent receptor [Sphingomonas pollutisoli]